MSFRLTANFSPTGDQPQAIERLTHWLRNGVPRSTLLGVTGSGKSVVGATPILIRRGGRIQLIPIKNLVDPIINQNKVATKIVGDTEILEKEKCAGMYAFSLNPATKKTGWKPLSQITRHRSPSKIYYLKTTCGKEVSITGDHNLWVLRNGQLKLIETQNLQAGDYLPTPRSLPGPRKKLLYLELLPYLKKINLFVNASRAQATSLRKTLYDVLGHKKTYGVIHQNERIPINKFVELTKIIPSLSKGAKIGVSIGRYEFPIELHLTPGWLKFFGFYIAEGHAAADYIILSTADRITWTDALKTLQDIGLTGGKRAQSKYDYQISSKVLAEICRNLCGSRATEKRLPPFWPQLTNKQLGVLLSS